MVRTLYVVIYLQTHEPCLDTMKRFDKLAELVTDTIVPGWLYASSRVETMVALVDALSLVVQTLGIGSVRFLKASLVWNTGTYANSHT